MISIPVLVQLLHVCFLGDFNALYCVITQVIYNTGGYDDVTQVVIHDDDDDDKDGVMVRR